MDLRSIEHTTLDTKLFQYHLLRNDGAGEAGGLKFPAFNVPGKLVYPKVFKTGGVVIRVLGSGDSVVVDEVIFKKHSFAAPSGR